MRFYPQHSKPLFQAIFLACCLLFFEITASASPAASEKEPTWEELDKHGFPQGNQLKALLEKTTEATDLARAKLEIDKLVDPSIDIEENLQRIDAMTEKIRLMLASKAKPSDGDKMEAVRKFIYEAGAWNDYQVFSYDLADPDGRVLANKLLPVYLRTRKGNCVSMPILLAILGQRMGLDVTLSTAPLHVLVKYTDRSTGVTLNLEATSGGYPAREEWLKKQYPSMTDSAIKSGAYLKKLSKQESIAIMGRLLAEHLMQKAFYREVVVSSETVLKHCPSDAETMVRIGSSFYLLQKRDFEARYPNPADIPAGEQGYLAYLSEGNRFWFAKAESLGWREPAPENEAEYQKRVQAAKAGQKG